MEISHLGDVRAAGVDDLEHELLAGEQAVGHELAGHRLRTRSNRSCDAYRSPSRLQKLVVCSADHAVVWAISGEEAGGDGEIGEPSYLAPLIIFWGLWRKLHFVHFSAVLAEVNESISVFGGV